jgi:membrane associated rhomboid family serine protease/Flp pilus assembly protein TadD
MSTCTKCAREHGGEGPLCQTCQGAAPNAVPVVGTPGLGLSAPVTLVLVALNAAVFVYMLAKGAPLNNPSVSDIIRFGANFGPLTLGNQWWRMVTAIFVHIGLMHLLINEWCLWDLGFMAEQLYGPRTFLAVYLISGITGSLVSVAHNFQVVSAGASGAIFGIAGALITTLHFGHIPAPRKALRASLISLIVFAVFNLAYGFYNGHIDNCAHVGGLVAGLLLGAILSRDFTAAPKESRSMHVWVIPVCAVALFVATLAVRHVDAPMVALAHAGETLSHGDVKGGQRELAALVQAHPDYANGWMAIAELDLRQNLPADAEHALKMAAQAEPRNPAPLRLLSALYLRTNRFQEAADILKRMIEANPNDIEAYINRGVALNRLDKPQEAIESFKKAVSLNPKLPVAWYNLGLSDMSVKHYDDAIAAFQKVTALVPEDADAWIWLSNAYQQKGMSKEANAAYEKGYALRIQRMRQQQQQSR